jgi:hypothetical protein
MMAPDPDPRRVLEDLRARLVDLRFLASQFPHERAYPVASSYVVAALTALEPMAAATREDR